MLSESLITYFKTKNWWFDEAAEEYRQALTDLGIDLESDFAKFYLHVEDGPTFISRNREIYQIGWFLVNSSDYKLLLDNVHGAGKMPDDYLPLDSFHGEYGYFYNQRTDEVAGIGLGKDWQQLQDGELQPQWSCFNDFLEWFFEIR